MRIAILSFLVALPAAYALAVPLIRDVVISYPNNTPQHVIDQAMNTIREGDGLVLRKLDNAQGFKAVSPDKALGKVQSMNTEYAALIQEDRGWKGIVKWRPLSGGKA